MPTPLPPLTEVASFDPGADPYEAGMPLQTIYELVVMASMPDGSQRHAARALFTAIPGVLAAQAAVFDNMQHDAEASTVLLAAIATHGLPMIDPVGATFARGEERLDFKGIKLLKRLLPAWVDAVGSIRLRRGRLFDPKAGA